MASVAAVPRSRQHKSTSLLVASSASGGNFQRERILPSNERRTAEVVSRPDFFRQTCGPWIPVSEMPSGLRAFSTRKDFSLRSPGKTATVSGLVAGTQDWRRSDFAAKRNSNWHVVTRAREIDMFFNGKKYDRISNDDPKVDHSGEHLRRLIAAEVPKAQANQRALQALAAKETKRRREEDRATAALIGQSLEE
jgi:hypothetical protein